MSFGQTGSADTATAANATINVNGGGLIFEGNTTAGNATIFVSSAAFGIGFGDNATGGNARFVLASDGFGGLVDFSFSAGAGGLGVMTAGSIEGGGEVRIGGPHSLFRVGSNNLSTEFSGLICECGGPAGLEKVGTGTMILSGNNTYTGDTTITAGTLQLGNGGTTGSVFGNIVNNSVLALNRSDSFDFANNVSGTGVLNHIGAGTTTLTGANTYTGTTNVIAGTLRAGGVNAFGVGSAVTVSTGAALALNNFNQTVGSLAGDGGVSLGTATLTLGGNNLSTNMSGVISGTGAVVKNGTGTLILAGNNTFSGNTTINGGTLQLGDGGTSGSVLGNIVNNGILAIDRSNNITLGGVISGTGALQQNGAGVTTLTGINTYTGLTSVNAGGLIVNGSIGTSQELIVATGAFVGGSGILPSTTVSGVLSPGNSVGTITIQGNLTMTAGSSYLVELDGGESDRINVSGIATLAGNVIAVPLSPLVPRTYTILHADGGLSGVFTGLDRSFIPPALRISLTHTANDVLLTLTAGLSQFGLNRNQLAAATAIDNAANASAALNSGFVTLFNLPGSALPGALTQLSGEVATGASTAGLQLMNQYLSLLLNPFAEQRGGGAFGPAQGFASAEPLPREIAEAYAAVMPVKAAPQNTAQRWSVWGAAYGGANKTQGDGATGSQDIAPRGYGFALGADYRAAPGTLLGFSIAGGGTNWALGGGLGNGRSDVFQAGVYASRQFGAAYVSGALAAAWHEGSTDRTISVAGVDRLRGDFNAASFGARLEGGYRFAVRGAGITPYAAVQAQGFRNSGFGETAASGSAQFALNYGATTASTVRTELGAWADSRFVLAGGNALALRGRLAWAHDDGDGARMGATFQGLPGGSFTVLGAAAPSDLALASAGAELRLRNNLSIGAKFDGEFANRSQTYSGAGTVRYVW